MSSMRSLSVWSKERPDQPRESGGADPQILKKLGSPVRRAITRTRQWLLAEQNLDGSWCAELEGDTLTETETILLLAYFGRENSDLARRAAAYIVDKQLPEGGWALYPGGKLAISGSVEAYFALKLTGHDPSAEYMQRARAAILAHGGADAVNSYTRFFLALLGQISYEQCPAVPPEIMLLPKWFPINIYGVSAWSRTIVVPLSIVSAFQPVREIDPRFGIRELFIREPADWPPLRCPGLKGGAGLFSWDRFFRIIDNLWKWCQRRRFLPFRRRAVAGAKKWMLERFQESDGLGAIYPPIVWSLLALKCLGYADDSPEVRECFKQLEALVIEDHENGAVRVQPCKSPVWDTSITFRALSAGGIGNDSPSMRRAIAWLLNRRISRLGDWAETVKAEPGGWCFEYANAFYPDVDDTAMTLMALQAHLDNRPDHAGSLPPALRVISESDECTTEDCPSTGDCTDFRAGENGTVPLGPSQDLFTFDQTIQAIRLGEQWILAMQNSDGGWGAFDRNNNREFLCHVPFADHNAMIDPSTPDLTGRVLEALGKLGRRLGDPAVDRAVAYVRRSQQPDGSWFGRWGVNYIYGAWQAITGLTAVGVPVDDPAVAAGANWLLAHQQPCGGWGESPDSYKYPHLRGQGDTTASQTAWAVMGLIAAGLERNQAVIRAVRYLTVMQNEDGSWDEPEFTGTGFPQVYYLRYHYYPIYFPLLALSQWALKVRPKQADNELSVIRPRPHASKIPASIKNSHKHVFSRAENY
jgi:squalene-hopene/tetraprenyl-beta-curcumene cyclase